MKIRRQDCGRTVEVSKDWDTSATCSKCSGSFEALDSEEDTYEDEEEEESEEDTYDCENCRETFELNEVKLFKDEINEEDYNFAVCLDCLKKYANISNKTEIVYKDRIVEKPIIKYIDKETNQEIKQENKSIFNSVL